MKNCAVSWSENKVIPCIYFLFICTTLNASWLAPMKNRAVSGSENKVIPCVLFLTYLHYVRYFVTWSYEKSCNFLIGKPSYSVYYVLFYLHQIKILRAPMKNRAISWSENKDIPCIIYLFLDFLAPVLMLRDILLWKFLQFPDYSVHYF